MPRPASSLHVVVAAPVGEVGGQANAAVDIARGFAASSDVRVTVVTSAPRLSGALGWLTRAKGVRSIVRPLLYAGALLRAVPGADVVHVFGAAHTAFFFGAAPAVLVAGLFGRPVVLNYHDGRAEEHYRRWPRTVRWAVRRAAVLAFPSAFLRDAFRRWGFEGVVVPNVVDTAAFTYRPPVPPRPRLISTRLLESLYAVENTIRAFALVRAEVPEATLDLYGAGVAEAALRREAEAVGVGGIRFHGGVPRATVAAAYADGGVLVNSSRVDNMPLCLLEAFAAGVPIVTTAAGGIPHVVEDGRTALVVPFDDPRAMADAILRLLREPGLAERLAGNGSRELPRYTWAAAADGWRAVYARAARRLPSAGSQVLTDAA